MLYERGDELIQLKTKGHCMTGLILPHRVKASHVVLILSVASSCSRIESIKSSVLGIFGKNSRSSQQSERGSDAPKEEGAFSYFSVKKATISDSVSFDGKLEPAEKIEIRADKRVRIGPAKFKIGDEVKRGSVLFVVDTKDLEQKRTESKERLDQLNVDIKSSKAQFTFAAKQLERKTGLVQKGIAAQKELEEAEKAFIAAEADLKTKELELRKSEREFASASESVTTANIVSPIDGIVSNIIPGGDDVNQGQQLATVANPKYLAITGQVDEINVTKFRQGQSVSVALDATKGADIKGIIKSIDVTQQRTGAMTTYSVVVGIPPEIVKTQGLRVGYSAKVTSTLSAKPNALVIPRAALRQEGAQFFVLAADGKGKTPSAKAIKIGIQTDLEAEVTGGLKTGDYVVVSQKATGGQ